MLLVAACGLMVSLLLAIELLRDARGMPAFFAAGLLFLSPVFFSQAMLAQLDAPAMLFTALALLLFVQNRIVPAAAACLALVLVKETGVVAPLVLGLWLARERRWRDAAWFLGPVGVVCVWIGILAGVTGHWPAMRRSRSITSITRCTPCGWQSIFCAGSTTCSSPTYTGLEPSRFSSHGEPAPSSAAVHGASPGC